MNKGKLMRKLLGQPATAVESSDIIDPPPLRPNASQNTVYSAGAPITCLDRSPDGQRAVIAGSKAFRIIRVDGSTITEDVDLRAAISSHAPTQDISASTDQLNIKDVKWSHGALENTIITAGGNGRISIYDLTRGADGFETARIQEHARQVHKLSINPFMCNWLLSASQDGNVRSFDLRTPGRGGPVFRTLNVYKCNADAVRDVEWSPADGMEFACSTDTGVIQKWDIRKALAPVLKIPAHQSPCFSISWHPDGEHLISGGKDQWCHVWDLSKTAERGQKSKFSFTTPAPISSVSWRPPCWSASAQARRAAQVTVAYDDSNANKAQTSTVHLWDLARPTLPFKEIDQWNSSPTGLLWNTRDLLWSVDKEGHFIQTDVAFSPKVIDRRSLSSFTFSPIGDVLMLLEERQMPRRSRRPMNSPELSPSLQHNSVGPLFSASRSDSEEDIAGSFLGPRVRKNHRRRHSGRSVQTLSTTPPSGIADNKVLSLDDAVKLTGIYKPQQVMALGHAPSSTKRSIYKYLTNCYLQYMSKISLGVLEKPPINIFAGDAMEHFARTAETIGHYRLAQTWRLLAFTMNLFLDRRAEHHRNARLQKPSIEQRKGEEDVKETVASKNQVEGLGEETPRRFPRSARAVNSPLHPVARSTVADEAESTSNVATPLVRPVSDVLVPKTTEAIPIPMIDRDVLTLPPAVMSQPKSSLPLPISSYSSGQAASSVEGYDFYGMESFSPLNDFGAPPRKQPLRLEYADRNPHNHRMAITRHDSGESFQMFSTSGDSAPGRFMPSSESEVSPRKDSGHSEQSLRERVSSWEDNVVSHSRYRPSFDSEILDESSSGDIPDSHNTDSSTQSPEIDIQPAPSMVRLKKSSEAVNDGLSKAPDLHTPPPEKISDDPNIIESDYYPWPRDPDFIVSPIDPTLLVQRIIAFETQTGSLNASAILLLLRPLLPLHAIDSIQSNAILTTYHHRLTAMSLFSEAALLRNLCVPLYSSVFATSQREISIAFFCTSCSKPLDNDPLITGSQWRCPRCKGSIDACSICKHREVDGMDQEWWYCPGCGHGGHMQCMREWHAGEECEEGTVYSGGCCPLEGCLHPCLPGTWRSQRAEEQRLVIARTLETEVRRGGAISGGGSGGGGGRGKRESGLVRRDPRQVNQSKAVEGVRVALGFPVNPNQGQGLERKRSVKVIAPGEEGQ